MCPAQSVYRQSEPILHAKLSSLKLTTQSSEAVSLTQLANILIEIFQK